MDTTDYARLGVYSTDSAPGIIVAHGRHTFRVRIVGLCVWLLTVLELRPKVCLGQQVYTYIEVDLCAATTFLLAAYYAELHTHTHTHTLSIHTYVHTYLQGTLVRS